MVPSRWAGGWREIIRYTHAHPSCVHISIPDANPKNICQIIYGNTISFRFQYSTNARMVVGGTRVRRLGLPSVCWYDNGMRARIVGARALDANVVVPLPSSHFFSVIVFLKFSLFSCWSICHSNPLPFLLAECGTFLILFFSFCIILSDFMHSFVRVSVILYRSQTWTWTNMNSRSRFSTKEVCPWFLIRSACISVLTFQAYDAGNQKQKIRRFSVFYARQTEQEKPSERLMKRPGLKTWPSYVIRIIVFVRKDGLHRLRHEGDNSRRCMEEGDGMHVCL